ncbi:MAG: alpha amylase C-terminal domain-containing protein, partial [Chitinophagaceae bacterium]
DKVFSFLRKKEDREVLVVLNLSGAQLDHFAFTDPRISGTYRNIFNNVPINVASVATQALHPWDYQVLEK